jgi:ABC-type amino acid transport system permease subunit
MKTIQFLSIAYIELIRGIPLITILFMVAVMLPMEKSVTFTGACANEIIPNG